MAFRLFVSDHTYRKESEQLAKLRKEPELADAPVFRPEDIPTMFRLSQRAESHTYYAVSAACFAPTEKEFIKFIDGARKAKVRLGTLEEGLAWGPPHQSTGRALKAWKVGRRNGAAKAGGDAKSDNSLLKFWEGFSKIKDRWHLGENSKVLMKEAGIKHHDTVRANLGHTRWEWRSFSDAKRSRVLKQLEKGVIGGKPSPFSDKQIKDALKEAKGSLAGAAKILKCAVITIKRRKKMWSEKKKLQLPVKGK